MAGSGHMRSWVAWMRAVFRKWWLQKALRGVEGRHETRRQRQ